VNIQLENLIDVLALYNIIDQISDFKFFINSYNDKTSEMKVITKVDFANRNSLVVKFVREDRHPHNIIEKQSKFSEYLRGQGILTPRRYISGDNHCIKYKLKDMCLDVTVEDYLGEEIKNMDFKIAYKIGQLIARIHNISEKGNCHIGANTIFNVAGYNEVIGYDGFVELGESGKIDSEIYQKIKKVYSDKLKRIKLLWGKLPKYATQGDCSINNLTYIGEELGIFDYNIAGDETLVGDMVLEGLLTANEMDLAEGLSDRERMEIFRCFYNGYIDERPLTADEKNVLSDIFAISSGLWFTKIVINENSLTKLVERNEIGKADLLLQEIYKALCKEDFPL
jgi:Ser/Thr protein kinase RdoA (MazF antagonist)